MSNRKNRGVLKEDVQQGLDSFFCNDINVWSGFIKDNNLALSHDGTANADKLFITIAEVSMKTILHLG